VVSTKNIQGLCGVNRPLEISIAAHVGHGAQ
jgi:hypothetical protein